MRLRRLAQDRALPFIGNFAGASIVLGTVVFLESLPFALGQDLDIQKVGSYQPTNCYITAVALAGNTAYIFDQRLNGDVELAILDVSDVTHPRKLGGLGLTVTVKKMAFDQGHLYLACGYDGLIILDVLDPANPREIGSYDTSGDVNSVVTQGNRVFIMDAWGSPLMTGLLILDATDPANLNPIATNRFINGGSIAVSGNRVFAGYINRGLQVIGPADAAYPIVQGSYETGGNGFAVVVQDNYAYLADGSGGLSIFDVTQATPRRVAQFPRRTARDVTVIGNRAYWTSDYSGLEILDITNPSQPARLGSYIVSAAQPAVAATATHAFLAAGTAGLLVLDTTIPTGIPRVGVFPSIAAGEILAAGNRAYVAAGDTGIVALDISIPVIPQKLGAFPTQSPRALQISGNILYVSGEYGVVDILDVSAPAQMKALGRYILCPGCHAGAMSLVGNRLLLLNPYAHDLNPAMTFNILDLTNPIFPHLLGGWDNAAGVTPGLATVGNVAYVAGQRERPAPGTNNKDSLTVIDFSNPQSPRDLGFVELPILPRFATVTGNRLYVGSWNTELLLFDITDPLLPRQEGSMDVRGAPSAVTVRDPYAYVAASEAGLLVLDVSDPAHPTVATRNSAFHASSVQVAGDHLLVGGNDGIQVLKLYSPPIHLSGQIENGGFKLTIGASGAQVLRIQRASTLPTGWEDWKSIVLSNGTAEVLDLEFSGRGQSYYRAIADP